MTPAGEGAAFPVIRCLGLRLCAFQLRRRMLPHCLCTLAQGMGSQSAPAATMSCRDEPDPKKRRTSDEHGGSKHPPIRFEGRSTRIEEAAGGSGGADGGGNDLPPRPERSRSRR